MTNKIQINDRFGKLIILSKGTNIIGGNTIKRSYTTWICKCDCGNIKQIKSIDLNRGSVKSCGCLIKTNGRSYRPGKKFGRLTTISYKNSKWFCRCDCGEHIEIYTEALTSGNTKSCGCLKIDVNKSKIHKLIEGRRKFPPNIASARRVWKNYKYRDSNMTISFDEFLKLSQQNCHYCGVTPNNFYNYFLTTSSRSSTKAKEEGLFIYNGIDRINSSLAHTLHNVVPSCIICNRAKNNRSYDEFISWANKLNVNNFEPITIINKQFPTGSLATSIKCVFYNYKDTDLTLEEYYSISQMNCFYCNSSPNNIFNKAKTDKKSSNNAKQTGDYIYNGLDRIDCKLPHNKNNIVPCCYNCNWAKNKLDLSNFYDWIKRIQNFQIKKRA